MTDESLFNAALAIGSLTERAAFLDQHCAGKPTLRKEVEELLAAHAGSNLLDRPPVDLHRTGPYRNGDDESIAEGEGTVIGPYILREQIGEGGFGLVFVAEQQQPVRRKVALKVIKPGMDTRQVVARFEAERQALALMDHPNIARVLDAGTTESGRPYFVMELVKGIPITEYADANNLSPRDRLGLFVQVCNAVQHAHQKGIIHRDLKPSNILVAPHDGVPVVKVIDFGVAKALGQSLTEKTVYTRFAQMIGTPLYMSPEQAEVNQLDVDTRSDIYSLGVLLYELLTGTTPFDRQRFARAAFDEIRRIIKEEEPPRPSTRLTSLGATLTAVSAKRGTDPGRLAGIVRGELDWIVMRCLEKDRSRRYDSAAGLAKDVQRFLADEPVEARPASAWYRFQKMARRNKAALTTTAVVAAALVAGTAVSIWQAVRATDAERAAARDRDAAEANARSAEANEELARREADRVRAAEGHLRRTLYVSRANLIRAAWDAHDVGLVLDLLDRQKPGPGEEDLRGFEWHYFDRLCHADRRTVSLGYDWMKSRFGTHPVGFAPVMVDQAVVFSADGRRCAAVPFSHVPSRDRAERRPPTDEELGAIKVWDVTTGRELFAVPEKPKTAKYRLALSRDGRRLAVLPSRAAGGLRRREGETGPLTVWDVDTKARVFTAPTGDGLTLVALSPDGRRVAAVTDPSRPFSPDPRTLKVWDVDQIADPVEAPTPPARDYTTLTFTADGSRLVLATPGGLNVANSENVVTTFAADTGRELSRQQFGEPLRGRTPYLPARAVLSPDGSRLTTVTNASLGQTGSRVAVWDLAGEQLLSSFEMATAAHHLAVTPDGAAVAVWSSSAATAGEVRDAATGRVLHTIKGHTRPVVALAFDPDGTKLVSADAGGIVKEWDVPPLPPGRRDLGARPERVVKVSADRSRQVTALWTPVMAGAPAGTDVRVLDAAGKELFVFHGHTAEVTGLAISADGRHVVSEDRAGGTKVWESATGTVLLDRTWPSGRPRSGLARNHRQGRAVFSPDGRRLAEALPEGGVKVWELAGLREVFSADAKAAWVEWVPGGRHVLTWQPIGDLILMSSASHLTVWDLASGQSLFTHRGTSPGVRFSPDGRWAGLWVPGGRSIKVIETDSGAERLTLAGPDAGDDVLRPVLAFSPDGSRLAAPLLGGGIKVWSVPDGREVFHLKGHVNRPTGLAFSPDGTRLASATESLATNLAPLVVVWDMATGTELMRTSHRASRTGPFELMFSRDGHRLALGDLDDLNNPPVVLDATPRAEPRTP